MKTNSSSHNVFQILANLPSSKQLFFGIIRLVLTLILLMALWQKTGVGDICTQSVKGTTNLLIQILEKPEIKITKFRLADRPNTVRTRREVIRKNITAILVSEIHFTIMLPMLLLSVFPILRIKKLALNALLATSIMAVYCVFFSLLHAYVTYYKTMEVVSVSKIGIGFSYFIMPVVSVIISMFIVGRKSKPINDRTMHKKNDPCPCGSGLKFKKCCALK